MSTVCDAHCHFFSARFLEILTAGITGLPETDRATAVAARLGWDPPESPEALADRWIAELDAHGVSRCSLIASVPGDEASVATAVARYPARFVGFFMCNPTSPGAHDRIVASFSEMNLSAAALFPAMHGYRLDEERVVPVFEAAAAHGRSVFVHCGVLSVGVRKKLGLPSHFDLRLGDPLAVAAVAQRFPTVPVIIPHFGAGLFREALMAADQSPNIYLDTSSSNGWMKYHPGLSLAQVFRSTIDAIGAGRLLFGTDSSFFPRGWQTPIFETQMAALDTIGVSAADRSSIVGGNFDRLFPRDSR
jgi:predicted TIM-barrel fold metal-dependent hydrolase